MTRFTRRDFLAGAAGAGLAGGTGLALAHHSVARTLGLGGATHPGPSAPPATHGAASLPTGKGTLVLITLYGGNDGLNTVIPYSNSAYLAGRSTLGYQPNEVLTLDKNLGLHPSLTGLKSLWDAQHLAVVLGVGYPQPNRSHFRSMDIWQSGVPETDELTGWLGRWLDQGGDDPLRALSFGPTLPKLLEGAKKAGGSVPSGNLGLPDAGRLNGPFAEVETVSFGQSALAARVAQSGTDLLTVIHTVGDVLATQPATDIGGSALESNAATPASPSTTLKLGQAGQAGQASRPAPAVRSELATQLDLVARLIKGAAPTRVYAVSLGGFDTHAAEKANHARLMGELDAGIAGFLRSLDGDSRGDNVVVMTYSEFGRRVNANASGGTDHGTAAPLFVAGKAVTGGFYGGQPSLTDLDQGDLKFTTDFRSVYATVMDKVLGIDPKPILSGKTFPTLAFV